MRRRWRSSGKSTRRCTTVLDPLASLRDQSRHDAVALGRAAAATAAARRVQGGVAQFVHDCLEAVFAQCRCRTITSGASTLPAVTPALLPRIPEAGEFPASQAGLHERIDVQTDSVQGFLEKNETPISRFVLLDHQDWLTGKLAPALERSGNGSSAGPLPTPA